MADNATIPTKTFLADIENELSDLYTDGGISAAIYNLKNQKRMLVHSLMQADRHICLQLKVAAHVVIFVPSGIRTIFFDRQGEYIGDHVDDYDELTDDEVQFSLLISEDEYLDVISVLSNWAHAYGDIPVQHSEPKETLRNSTPGMTDNPRNRKYQLTSGSTYYESPEEKRFYCEPNSRKMILSQSFESNRWLRFKAQIAPVDPDAVGQTDHQLDDYVIRSPYFARQWLLVATMQRLLSLSAAQAGGYFDLEQKFKKDAFDNKPGTGNVIISGQELDGNYENHLNDF